MTRTLYMSARSPFARRVRLALEELGVVYSTEVLDVFNLPPGYHEINPLGRVPVLRTAEGEYIVESWMILDQLKAENPTHPIFQFGGYSPARARGLSGLAVGVMEQVVASYLEGLRGPGVTSFEAFEEARDNARRGLKALELVVAPLTTEYLTGGELRLCDIDVGTAVAYTRLRLPGALDGCAALGAYLERLNRRPSFAKTVPPP